MSQFQSSRLSDSSDDDGSSDNEYQPARKRQRREFSLGSNTSGTSLRDSFTSDYDPRESRAPSQSSENEQRGGQSTEDSVATSEDEKPPVAAGNQERSYNNQERSHNNQERSHNNQERSYDNKAKKMMVMMGYKEGLGLGKHAQGRVDPVEASRQRGRRGLGLHIKGLEAATLKWDSSLEVVSVEEKVAWLTETNHDTLSRKELDSWLTEGTKKLTIDDETSFCDPDLLRNVISSKSVFDQLEPEELRKARTRSNPFETIRGGFFLNRAAMKMANMDRVFDFMFTNPCDQHGNPLVSSRDLLYFCDVCAGPGGFSEYVLWRQKWKSKGFGFTLKGENDFRLADFYAGPCETFQPYYGVGGADGDGNIYNPDNIAAFTEYVLTQTDGVGAHFMMADGGFSVDGQENIQEILSKQLYLCQFLVALSVVRIGGNFVCKVFDLFTPFSVGLVYLMYKSFVRVSIHKPNTSRPANSERYLVCQWKRDDSEDIRNYMFRANKQVCKMGIASQRDITTLVPMSVLTADDAFFSFIVESNNSLGERQVVNLVKIAAFCRDVTLHETQQAEMRRRCLEMWKVPDKARTAPPRSAPDTKCDELVGRAKGGFLSKEAKMLTESVIEKSFRNVYDWHCVVLASSRSSANCAFFLSLGRSNVYRRLNNGRWTKEETVLEMSADTLVYGELVDELRGDGRSQRKIKTLHIIDAIILGGEDQRGKHLSERLESCDLFARALSKPCRTDVAQIRVKRLYDLEDVRTVFDGLEPRVIKWAGGQMRLCHNLGVQDDRFFVPGGVMFLNASKDPWMRCMSQKTGYKYYFDRIRQESKYDRDRPAEACASFADSFERRHVWYWEEEGKEEPVDRLHHDQLIAFVEKKVGA